MKDDLWVRLRGLGSATWKGCEWVELLLDGSNMPSWIRNNILDFPRPMPVKMAVENGKICNKTTMGERL